MTITELVLIAIGIVAFVISFFIDDKKISQDDACSISEEEIRQIVNDEYERTKSRLNDISDETISYGMEKAERKLERITNEKMMALGEYSDTIINQINTNHQEAVFLHEMLNNNKNDLTNMLGQALKDAEEAEASSKDALLRAKEAKETAENAIEQTLISVKQSSIVEENMINARKALNGDSANNSISGDGDNTEEELAKKPSKPRKRTSKKKEEETEKTQYTQMSLRFDTDSDESQNNNERILKLHKEGKSNVAIAKELGLGVGEVNLVINLFK